jgi:hypothetical protein
MRKTLFLLITICSFLCNSQVSGQLSFVINSGTEDKTIKHSIESNTTNLILKLNEAYLKGFDVPLIDQKTVSPGGLQTITDLWKDEHFYCYVKKISENLVQKNTSFQVRNIPFIFGKTDTVDIVITYLQDGRIDDFYIGLEEHQYKGVLDVTGVSDQTRVKIILNFIENLRTYYIKKDIDNIQKLYSDKALIIIGKVLKNADVPVDQVQTNFTKPQVQYLVLTKSEYLSRLQQVFDNTSYLMLDFKSIEVIKHRRNINFYGVLLRQTWNSSTYSDDGWLFLLVQFRENDEQPLIWVRTWQDVKDTPADSVFGLHNFRIPSEGVVTQ